MAELDQREQRIAKVLQMRADGIDRRRAPNIHTTAQAVAALKGQECRQQWPAAGLDARDGEIYLCA